MKFLNYQNFSKRFFLLLFATSIFGVTFSQNIISETFSYGLGDTLTNHGYSAHSAAGINSIKIAASALTLSGYSLSGIGGSIKVDTTGEDVNRNFLSRTSGSVYATFLVKITKAKSAGNYFFHLGPTTIGSTFFTKVFAKSDASNPNSIAFGISKTNNSSTATYSTFNYYVDTVYQIVVSYSFVPGTSNDTVTMWVNPTSSSYATPTLMASDYTVTDKTEIGSFAFRQGSNTSSPRSFISGLKIDTTWSNLFTTATQTVATPTISSASGTYENDIISTISCTTAGSTIRYTIDGSSPTSASPIYSIGINIGESTVLKARGFKAGMDSSSVATAIYNFMVSTPIANPIAGSFTSAQNISLSTVTTSDSIYYTTDGTTPSAASTFYSSPIAVGSTTTIKAIALKNGYTSSSIFSGVYVINFTSVSAPIMSSPSGTYYSNKSISLTSTTAGTTIRYTVDGTNPNSTSTIYSSAISISQNTVLKAIAYLTSSDSSTITTATYILKVDTVISNLISGSYFGTQNITLTSSTNGAQIYYTLDGSAPNSNSTAYSSQFVISNSLTLKAIAYKTNWDSSIVSTWSFVISPLPSAIPYVDTFAYGINSLLTDHGYTAHSSSGNNSIKVNSSALYYYNYIYSNTGNSILLDTTGEDINKTLSPKTSGSVYVGFLTKILKSTPGGEYFFHLGNDILSTTFRGKLFVRSDTAAGINQINFGVSKSTNTANYSQAYSSDSTYLIVLKYTLEAGTNNDSVLLWINPNIASKTNPDLICNDLITSTDLMNIGTFAFRQGSSVKAARILISGFVIDTVWENILTGINAVIQAPTVATYNSNSISAHSAILNGKVVSDGGAAVSERGFYYSTNTTPDFTSNKVIVSGTTGNYSATVLSLISNSTYYYRAYAINVKDTSLGNIVSFSTLIDGLNSGSEKTISYFPNPVENQLNIKNATNYNMIIYSVIGTSVFSCRINKDSYKVDLTNLPSGVYFISLLSKDYKKSFRIIKK
ncbi:MAG: hypothetical protein AUJ98_08490 [Bacteroidetes bacterium CG2_30_33_31]|nr:MAG: hypothetical protein AUJ98_08490 [Bacteroidetes bacterium CG2_30_33_31]